MVPHSRAGRSLIEFLVTLLIGMAPIACGLLVLSIQVDRKTEDTIAVTSREAVYAIDRVIQTLHETSNQALWLATRPCDEILSELRLHVDKQPNVRTLALKNQGRVFCSSLYGATDHSLDPGNFVNERLRVDPGNRETPGSAILLYRVQAKSYAAIAAANLRVLQAELLGFQNAVVLSLQFGDQYVWATGNGELMQVPNQEENTLMFTSERFGYTVHAGYPAGEYWQSIRQTMHSTLPSLLLVGIMTSAVGYWGLFRRGRSRSVQEVQ